MNGVNIFRHKDRQKVHSIQSSRRITRWKTYHQRASTGGTGAAIFQYLFSASLNADNFKVKIAGKGFSNNSAMKVLLALTLLMGVVFGDQVVMNKDKEICSIINGRSAHNKLSWVNITVPDATSTTEFRNGDTLTGMDILNSYFFDKTIHDCIL